MMVYIYCVANDCIKIVVNSNHVQNLFENDINSNGGGSEKGIPTWFAVEDDPVVDELPIFCHC